MNFVKGIFGDCLDEMYSIPDGSIDMILCDLPYGQTKNHWDSVISFKDTPKKRGLWYHYKRVTKENAAIVLFANGMFTSTVMCSNKKMWRYNLVWDKVAKTGFLNAKKMPLRQHEDICVFYKKLPVYHPQMIKTGYHKRNHSRGNLETVKTNHCYGKFKEVPTVISDEKYPSSILKFPKEHVNGKFFHPTQKPVELIKSLILSYTDQCACVLDNSAGSFTTAVACVETNRSCICIENKQQYFDLGVERTNYAIQSSGNEYDLILPDGYKIKDTGLIPKSKAKWVIGNETFQQTRFI